MNRTASFVCTALFLSACSPIHKLQWSKHGATEADFRRDQTECEVAALRDVPVQKRGTPLSSPTTTCTRVLYSLNCTSNPGIALVSDDNAELRKRAYLVCLEGRGWTQTRAEMADSYSRSENKPSYLYTGSDIDSANGTVANVKFTLASNQVTVDKVTDFNKKFTSTLKEGDKIITCRTSDGKSERILALSDIEKCSPKYGAEKIYNFSIVRMGRRMDAFISIKNDSWIYLNE
jgi:hypothetical protein